MKQTLERELKLSPPDGFQLPELGEALPARTFTSTYFDTSDRRLAHAGVTLRRRVEDRKGLWHLKLPRGASRLELELPGGPARVPERMRELLFAHLRGRELEPIAKLRTRRQVRRTDGAEIVLDSVALLDGGRAVEEFDELEVELVGGDEQELRRIERALRQAGATDGDARPKVFRALGVESVRSAHPPRTAPAIEHLRAMLVTQLERILAHDPGTRLGADPEELHQLRVATRRLRAFLRAARPLLDRDWAERLRAELAWLGAALGPVRDLDVLLEELHQEAAELDQVEQSALRRIFAALEEERSRARERLLEALTSERYLALLDALEAAAAAPHAVGPDGSIEAIAGAEFARLRKRVRKLDRNPSDEDLHATRIRGKRARYAAELAEPLAGKPASRFVARAKAFQDVVGEHQDAVVAEERIRELLRRVGGARVAFAAGRLVERQRARRAAARADFAGVWRQLDKAGKRAWS